MSYKYLAWATEIKLPNSNCFSVLCALASFASDNGICWPSQQSLADKTMLSRETVNRTIKVLKEIGVISYNGRQYMLNIAVTDIHNKVTDSHSAMSLNHSKEDNNCDPQAQACASQSHGCDPQAQPTEPVNKPVNKPVTPPTPPDGGKAHDDNFNLFWEIFPKQRKGSKEKAMRAWKKAIRLERPEIIAQKAKIYAQSKDVMRGFAKGAAAWLNDEGWTYEIFQPVEEQPPEDSDDIAFEGTVIRLGDKTFYRWLDVFGGNEKEFREFLWSKDQWYIRNPDKCKNWRTSTAAQINSMGAA